MPDEPQVVNRAASDDAPSIDSGVAVSGPDGAKDVGTRVEAGTTLGSDHGQGLRAGRGSGSRIPRRDLTTGSIPKHIWHLAWPQVVEGVLNAVDQIVDLLWAGRLEGGFRAIAGLGVGQSFTQFGMMTRQGLDQAMGAMVSRAVGAKNMPLANHIVQQAFTLTGIYSLLMVLVGVFLTDVLLRLIGASDAIQAQTAMYMRVQFVGMATMGFRMMSGMALQTSGNVMTPLRATFVTRAIHIVITPFLMFGWWGFPDLGLPGAALANVLAQLSGFAINTLALLRGSSSLHLTFRGYRLDRGLLWQMIKIGTPASLAGTERATAQIVLLAIVAPFGDIALAAYSLTRRLEMFTHFGGMGVGRASGIMVGQNLGAGRPDRAKQSIGWGLVYVNALKLLVAAVLLPFPAAIVMIFTQEPGVVELASIWLRLQVVAAIFMGMAIVFQQSFNLAGDTLAPLVVTFLAVWGVELPMAWLLLHMTDIGPLGIGYAGIVGMACRFLFYVPYFYWGRWLKIKVI